MRRLVLLAACLLGLAPALAQTVMTRQTTPGGMAYQHAAMPGLRYQVMHLGFKDALRLTDPADAFIPLLAPDALAEGPAGVGSAAFSETLEDLRAGFAISGQDDALRLSFHAYAGDFSTAADHIAALLKAPALSSRLFGRLTRDARLAALHNGRSAENLAYGMTLASLLAGHPRLPGLLREPAVYDAADPARLRAWFAARVARGNLVVATAGPLPPATLGPIIDRLAAALPQEAQAPAAEPPLPAVRAIRLVAHQPVLQTQIFAGVLVRGLDPARRVPVDLATNVLWSGFSSRLFMALRERLGAAYSASGQMIRISPHDQAAVIRTAVDPALAVAARAALAEEYARWWREGLTQEELEGARGRIAMWRREGQRAPAGLAGAMVSGVLAGQGDDPIGQAEARLNAATLDEVNAAIRAHFPAEVQVHVAVAPEGLAPPADCLVREPADVALCE